MAGRGEHAFIDHRAQRLWEKLSVQDPQRPLARLRRPATQAVTSAHVLHPPKVRAHTHIHLKSENYVM